MKKPMSDHVNWDLITKSLSTQLDNSERIELDLWLREKEEHVELYNNAKKLWEMSQSKISPNAIDTESALMHVKARANHFKSTDSKLMNKDLKVRSKTPFWYMAAAFAALLTTVIVLFSIIKKPLNDGMVLVEALEIKEVKLPDGSRVHLNVGSRMWHPEVFNDQVRPIILDGEAYFDVVPNPSKPFVIEASGARIEVLGTSFNVNARKGSTTVDVTVESGLVSVSNTGKSQEVRLQEGEIGEYFKTYGTVEKRQNDNPNYMSWRTKVLEFDQTTLTEVFLTLSQTYHTDLVIEATDIKHCRFSARFNNQELDVILEGLKTLFNLEIKQIGNKYIVYSGGC